MGVDGFWSFERVREAAGGEWAVTPDRPAAPGRDAHAPRVLGASIDTRTLRPGEVFFALRGERTDGHRFVGAAAAAGASMAVVEDPSCAHDLPEGFGVLLVADAPAALLRLGAAYRRTFRATRVVAVTGSNGKTTTTQLIRAVLEGGGLRGSASIKSYNNALGVPLTLLGVREGDRFVVCEAGTNSPGEIGVLADALRPDIAVITSIGRAHIEAFGSVERIAEEKFDLARAIAPAGTLVWNADAPCLPRLVATLRGVRTVGVGFGAGADLTIVDVVEGGGGVEFGLRQQDETGHGTATPVHERGFRVPLLGRHNATNAACAIAVARAFGVPDEPVRTALTGFAPPGMRLERRRIAGITVLNDAYNANPDSVLAGLAAFAGASADATRRVVVLGEMLELGAAADDAHREVARAAARVADAAVFVGSRAADMADAWRESGGGGSPAQVATLDAGGAGAVASLLRPGDAVFLKASRRLGLERVVEALDAAHPDD
ncbi:MAG: UDP-N-acetylmuramoyl-tripeptide--D-alanyl-D-alanine ligase [Phycisphaerales bacterium]|nr:UDP-N-acetylmuramoyl-tripeptide--D-alanyl-D-alanine ligase [Phycisphaerales bacterium]